MKYLTLAAGAMFAASAVAAPAAISERAAPSLDDIVLQFALTLEHLEDAFYHGALQKFSVQDFINAGYSATYYNNLKFIAHDEEVHVTALTAAIAADGQTPVAACKYSFPYTDVSSFITLSSVLEGVGTSAYLGGAPLITSKTYLTVAGSILVTEALHTSYQRAAKGEVPMANPFATPLDPTSVFTLAASFIVSCPSSNYQLPFTPFPALTYDATASCTCEEPECAPMDAIKKREADPNYPATQTWSGPATTTTYAPGPATPTGSYCAPPTAGASIKLTAAKPIPAGSFVTFVNGLSIVSVQGSIQGSDVTVTIPAADQGQTYVFITSADTKGVFSDSIVLFGPSIVEVTPPTPVINYSVV